ncbi:right-handed parallel beta-helix repeat-containing protein [Rubricoccus marinus]|uniref:Right handed beta helix domain-containing protein n=1 Tax=Rubricoccus marinus TaxID=716817 RepID=A0A259TZD4_9BACT|nr:right-handed parallel beta-helix repeat-containing protein [Rubricoccus marinus]OZC03046.1 hypothetical protein BSZ36_08735 [Rubricoccus marinus]
MALVAFLLIAMLGGCGEPEPVQIIRSASFSAEPTAPQAEVSGRVFVVDQAHPRASDRNPGSADLPWLTISRATVPGTLAPGDTVEIHEGVYRESIEPREGGRRGARITFRAARGETVVVTGADPSADGWADLGGGLWRRAWTGPGLPSYNESRVFRRELVVASGEVLRPASSRDDIPAGTFWAEGPPEAPVAIVARFPAGRAPEASGVEIATRSRLFWPTGADPYVECGDSTTPGYFHLQGLTFRHASNLAQKGAVCAGSRGSIMDRVRVEWTNGRGIDGSGVDHVFRRSTADYNGQMGWGASCTNCLWVDTQAVGNNWKGYDMFWEAGGGKWTRTRGTVIRRHTSRDNDGPGIWLDIDNADNTVEASTSTGDLGAGIMLEFETVRTLVQHNVVRGTRWSVWTGTGILSQAASHNVLLHNSITGNEGSGIWLRLDPLRRAPDGDTWVIGNVVRGNLTRGDVEAREISTEGLDAANVRSYRFAANAIGRVASGDPVLRATFFVHPTARGDYRGSDLADWRRWVRDDGSALGEARVAVTPLALPAAGAREAPARWAESSGAAPEAVGL